MLTSNNMAGCVLNKNSFIKYVCSTLDEKATKAPYIYIFKIYRSKAVMFSIFYLLKIKAIKELLEMFWLFNYFTWLQTIKRMFLSNCKVQADDYYLRIWTFSLLCKSSCQIMSRIFVLPCLKLFRCHFHDRYMYV